MLKRSNPGRSLNNLFGVGHLQWSFPFWDFNKRCFKLRVLFILNYVNFDRMNILKTARGGHIILRMLLVEISKIYLIA